MLVVGGIAFATYLSGGVDTGNRKTPAFFDWSFGIGGIIQYAVILAIVLWIAFGLRWRDTFALRRPTSIPRAIGLTLATYAVVFLALGLLSLVVSPQKEQKLLPTHWVHGHVAPFVLSVIAVAVVAPIVEELTFRGLGFHLLERYGRSAAIGGVGVAFGVWHGIPALLPVMIPFGAGLAYLRDRTDSVYPGIVAHALFNAVNVIGAVV